MNKETFDARLRALMHFQPTGDGGRIFVAYIDTDPARYLIDGVEVERAEWMERSRMAGPSSYTIEVLHREMEQPE